ncbi:hypothetical protein PHYPSEUDO_001976 [Phytophthora pseudosyringae]|uniref:Uncharacterized protein n=1 Tax=Phytophthora pseudosyringae TaxID=221518 RepID=A0A8T1VYS7_9STRA|nr:hypothetical protein PHYPSEUDO_001976 [Phytophthora pseudosyringae]
MEVALASLDRGVRALFTDSSSVVAAASAHPLCDCTLQQAPPPDWRFLRRFPVLKRHVLAEFRSVAVEMAKTPQTPRKRKKRGVAQQSGDIAEYKALWLASLCQKLAQCGLLTVGEEELAGSVVQLEALDVLRRVLGGRLLPLRLRLVLLGFTLREQGTKCLDAAMQSWIQEVCEKILEEVLEATATGRAGEPPSKRARTRSDDMKRKGEEELEKSCGFCRDGGSAESVLEVWDFLVECTQQTARALEKAGETYASNQVMVALSAFWDSLHVAGFTTSVKTGKWRKRSEIAVKSEEGVEPLMSVAAYERICHTTVGSSASGKLGGKSDAFRKMWTSVWDREFKKMAKTKHITLVDAIQHCSKADAFASSVLPPEAKRGITHLPGFRVVMEVIRSLFVDTSDIIAAFARVWSGVEAACSGAFTQINITSRVRGSSTKRILQSYLSELLKSLSVQHDVLPLSSVDKSPASCRASPLELLFFLYEIFSESAVRGQQNSSFSSHWDGLMTKLDSETLTKESAQDGINWCLFLEKCVHNLNTKGSLYSIHFLHAFKSYCRAIMHAVIASGGEIISSGGTIQQRLIKDESDRSAVRGVLAQLMITFGEDWMSSLLAQMFRMSASLRSTGLRGVRNLLFPALVSCMKSSSKGNLKRQKTGQQQFTGIVHSTNAILKGNEPMPLYLVSLMRFCEAWDVYQSTHTKEPPTRANRWGFRAMVELDMLPQLLECYERDEVVRQETSEALVFASEVLQNSPNCPQSLERSLYKVLSAVKAGAEHAKTSVSGPLGAADEQLVSHSSGVLQRLLRAVKFADLAQTLQLMSQIKDNVGTLRELRQQLERWISFVEVHGTAFAGKESRLALSLLCIRLIRWFPNEFESMRYLLMTPLDSHLVFALKAFVKEAGRSSNTERQPLVDSISTGRSALPSAVRVEMALHLYLSAAAFPDLETLTVLLTKAMIKCRSPDAFNHLAKVAQKNGRMLLPEAAVATLSSPLRGLEFSCSALLQQDEEGVEDEQIKNHARHAKAIIYQENTLKLLAASGSIFEGGISWSTVLFGEKSAVAWLPAFFEYILKTDFCEGTLRTDLLLTCLEELTQSAELGEKVLREAYWLAALLSTALVSCSSRTAGAYADVDGDHHNRLRRITGNVLQLLSMTSNATRTPKAGEEDDNTADEGILSVLPSSKCTRLTIEEGGACWSCERPIGERAASVLRMNVAEAWNAVREEDPHAVAVEPSIQLFVPFSHWLSGALVYSQSFLEEPSATMRRWERTFTSYVTDLYLPLEFEDVTCNLLKSWLTTWVTSNIVRGQEEQQLLALLPSQVALFRRLGLTPYRGTSQVQASTSLWQLVFVAINLAVDHHTAENQTRIEQATELVVSTLTTLELVELSASSDFVRFSNVQELEPFFEELDKFLSRPQLRVCSAQHVCCLLQYPLELVVCCYACKIPATYEAESQLFLQRAQKALQENFATASDDSAAEVEAQDSDEGPASRLKFAAESTEMDAFFQYWADEMLLKFDYLDRERCVSVLAAIQVAVRGDDDGA